MNAIELIKAERERQINEEGWDAEHDRQHNKNELAIAGACYTLPHYCREMTHFAYEPHPIPKLWPFQAAWWKADSKDRLRQLVVAGALIAAEIDRLKVLEGE